MAISNFKTRSAARSFAADKKAIGHKTKVIDNGADFNGDRWSVSWSVPAVPSDLDFKAEEITQSDLDYIKEQQDQNPEAKAITDDELIEAFANIEADQPVDRPVLTLNKQAKKEQPITLQNLADHIKPQFVGVNTTTLKQEKEHYHGQRKNRNRMITVMIKKSKKALIQK